MVPILDKLNEKKRQATAPLLISWLSPIMRTGRGSTVKHLKVLISRANFIPEIDSICCGSFPDGGPTKSSLYWKLGKAVWGIGEVSREVKQVGSW